MATDLSWKTVSMPPAFVGVPFEAGLATSGSATPITNCVVASGSLPPGVTIAPDFVRLQGTPTKKGSYTFTLTSTDTAGAVTSPSFTIAVNVGATVYRDMTQAPVAAQLGLAWPQ